MRNRFVCYIFGVDDALIGAGVGLFGGVLNNIFSGNRQEDAQNFAAQQQAQSQNFNAQQAELGRAFSASQSGINRDFQQRTLDQAMVNQNNMSSSSWQRGVLDMRNAGVNPILAYSKGGASTPSSSGMSGSQGAAPTASSSPASAGIAQTFDMVGPMLSSAKAIQEINNLRATEKLTTEQANQSKAAAGLLSQQGAREGLRMPVYRAEGEQGKNLEIYHGSPAGRALDIAGAGGQSVSKIVSPITDVLGTLSASKLLGRSRSTMERTTTPAPGGGMSTFEERFH
ncbi:DNA pilot protein [robinz microvirus RP_105]|nr:DNA pilot protein [robinz microvirus RP_105]